MAQRSLVLFGHGARDPRWAEPFRRLQQLTQAQMPEVSVSLAFLELMEPRLPELVKQLVQDGCSEVTIVPIFFGQGGHVLRDLPVMVDQLRQDYPDVAIRSVAAVGEDAEVLNAIARYCIGSLKA
ncbi:sirohydrochlorin chelatase [Noviherbaspirillum denitrificans]|uniref:Cobalamin biosynthesis protein CbiX n=1 Tax=Noviherbaspirillum denitrificans TaxID=1968433 RepID=A0A254TM19_9BURK|nr:CbiX/SirB N-terminal domain-containing protein [Noviherbaspirillum denitrificans]OWW22382.1 cobalamin biosynthesis protein CbiX [Noviherbaspirillum denitrificans]